MFPTHDQQPPSILLGTRGELNSRLRNASGKTQENKPENCQLWFTQDIRASAIWFESLNLVGSFRHSSKDVSNVLDQVWCLSIRHSIWFCFFFCIKKEERVYLTLLQVLSLLFFKKNMFSSIRFAHVLTQHGAFSCFFFCHQKQNIAGKSFRASSRPWSSSTTTSLKNSLLHWETPRLISHLTLAGRFSSGYSWLWGKRENTLEEWNNNKPISTHQPLRAHPPEFTGFAPTPIPVHPSPRAKACFWRCL